MNSIGETCNELKKKYDDCFNTWFSEHFLKGRTNDSVCAPLFKVYQDCVKKAMKEQNLNLQDIQKNLLGTSQEKTPPPKS